MESTHVGREDLRRDGRDHFAEVTVRAEPIPGPSRATFSAEALEDLRSAFGEDCDRHRHIVWSAIASQINVISEAGGFPRAGAASFHAEVARVRVSDGAGPEVSGFLLSVAAMNAIGAFLADWERSQGPDRRSDGP